MWSAQVISRMYTSSRGGSSFKSWREVPQVYIKPSNSRSKSSLSCRLSFLLQYSDRQSPHSSHYNIMSTFLTCCLLALKGSDFLTVFFALKDGRCSSVVGLPSISSKGRKCPSEPGVGSGRWSISPRSCCSIRYIIQYNNHLEILSKLRHNWQ